MIRSVGRYAVFDELAAGGMATVHLARQRGEEGFSRVVAVKVLHAQYAREESFRAMFLDEARLVSRIRHPNVVTTLDVLQHEGELFLVMEYVHGESLSRLIKAAAAAKEPIPVPIVVAIVADALEGLHAAHEARGAAGEPLLVVHRDVSPQNILVGADGVSTVADFGIAKAAGRLAEKFSVHETVKGKAGYMAPEQVRGVVDRRSDLYALGVVLWEALTGARLFPGDSFMEIITKSLEGDVAPPSSLRAEVPPALDAVALKALSSERQDRFGTAQQMALALETAAARATAREVGAWVQRIAHEALERRSACIARMERAAALPDGIPAADPTSLVAEPAREETDLASEVGVAAGVAPAPGPTRGRTVGRAMLPWLGLILVGGAGWFVVRSHPAPGPGETPAPASAVSAEGVSAAVGSDLAAHAVIVENEPVASSRPLQAPASPSASALRHPSRGRVPSRSGGDGHGCHIAEIPDDQGILHPKEICP